jgi:hypothetical protein
MDYTNANRAVLCPSCLLPMRQCETVRDALPHFQCPECRAVFALYALMPVRPIPRAPLAEDTGGPVIRPAPDNLLPCETPEKHLQVNP